MILRETAIDLLKKMVETPSVSLQEEAVASLLKNAMKELGYSVSLDSVGNVIGELGDGTPHVLLCGHMDTVPGDLLVSLDNGILSGRGSVDAKGPLASFVIAGKKALESGFTGKITVAGVIDEEGRNLGIKELIKHELGVDYAIFGEPTNMETLTLGYKGGVLFKVEVTTETGHSGAPWMFINAIEAGMDLFYEIKETIYGVIEESEGFNALTCTLRKIAGGGSHGSVPGLCEMEIGVRVPPSVDGNEVIRIVKDTVTRSNSETVKSEVIVIDKIMPYVADPKSKLIKSFTRAIYTQTKEKVTLVKKSATGDMNYYGSATGIPCVTYGPGNPHLDHTDEEHILIEDYLKAVEIITNALLFLEKLHV